MHIKHQQRMRSRALFALHALAIGCGAETATVDAARGAIALGQAERLDSAALSGSAPAHGAAPAQAVYSSHLAAAGLPYTLPPTTGGFDYQIAGRYTPDPRVSIISSDPAIAGGQALDTTRYNICYLNALQTQPDDYDWWMANYPDLILLDENEEPVHDPDPEWSGELLFDISTPEKRSALLELERNWIAGCRQAGYQAVEADNLDSYLRAEGAFGENEAEQFMKQFVAEVHAQGLAAAQKNAVEWVGARATNVGFDFAIVEECQLTNECDALISYYGPARVFEIEYVYDTADSSSGVEVPAGSRNHFAAACRARGNNIRIVLRNRDVRPAGARGFVSEQCGGQAPGEQEDPETLPFPESEPLPPPGGDDLPFPGEEPRDEEEQPQAPDGDEEPPYPDPDEEEEEEP